LEKLGAALEGAATIPDVQQKLADLKARPDPAEYPVAHDKQSTLIATAIAKLSRLQGAKDVREFKSEVDALLESKRFTEAAQRIVHGCNNQTAEQSAQADYRDHIPERLARRIVDLCRDESWGTATTEVENFAKDKAVRQLLGEQKAQQASMLNQWVNLAKDRKLYMDCIHRPSDVEKLRRYLAEVPDGEYRSLIQRRLDYVVWESQEATWTIKITDLVIKDTGATSGGDHAAHLELSYNDKLLAKDDALKVADGKTTSANLSATIPNIKPTAKLRLSANLKVDGWLFGSEASSAEWSGNIRDLSTGNVECVLKGGKASGKNRVWFSLDRSGIPADVQLKAPAATLKDPIYQ
jgi:hypothetical protein